MAQEWDPLSKANNPGIFIEMEKKLKVGVTVSFLHFSSVGFCLSKLDIKMGFYVRFLLKSVMILKM
jgi:hypothetical protein